MEPSYLPRMLESTLKTFAMEYGVTSWKICGGSLDNATVVIRYGKTSPDQQTQVTYRKKTPSAQLRDRSRLEQYCSQKGNDPSDVGQFNMDNLIEFKPGADMHGQPLPPLPTLPSSDEISNSGSMHNSTFVDNSLGLNDSGMLDTTTTCVKDLSQKIDRDREQRCTTPGETSKDTIVDTLSSEEDLGGICDDCGDHLLLTANIWYKCTACAEHDTCDTCFERGAHKHHATQMQMFREPENPENGYCNACGEQFHPDDVHSKLYHCESCEDYALCKPCNKKQLHAHHKQYINEITSQCYLSIIK